MKYVFGALATIMLLFLAVVFVFNRGDDTPEGDTKKVAQLVDYANKDSNVSITVAGPVVGDELHHSVRIIVSANERRLEVLNGYDESVVSSSTYPNTQSAYETFLSALGGQGFIAAKETSIEDSRSVCPTGRHFIYDVSENGQHVSNLWSVSCDKSGTFNGRPATVRQLFEKQIPDYSKQVASYKF